MSARTDEVVDRFHKQAAVLTAALALGVATFAAVAYVLVSGGGFQPALAAGTEIRLGAVALAAVLLGIARPMERRVDRPEPGADAETVARSWLSGTVVGMALREAVGLLGAVLILATGDVGAGGALALAALAVMAFAWPRRAELERRVRKAGA